MIGRLFGPAGRAALRIPSAASRRAAAGAVRRTSSTAADDAALPFDKITFVGTGKIAQAMINPLISQGLQDPGSICAYDVSFSPGFLRGRGIGGARSYLAVLRAMKWWIWPNGPEFDGWFSYGYFDDQYCS